MNRECRNCAHAERMVKGFDKNSLRCTKDGNLTDTDWFCPHFRPYTEKGEERKTQIPANAAMVSVPWDWINRIKSLEDRLPDYADQGAENREQVRMAHERLDTLEGMAIARRLQAAETALDRREGKM